MFYSIILALILATSVVSMPPIMITANVRGKRYEVEAESVEEVCKAVESQAGLEAGQYSVLYRGKVLSPADVLEKIGVSAGDTLNIVKGRRNPSASTRPVDDVEVDGESQEASDASEGVPSGLAGMDQYKKALEGLDPAQVQQAMKTMDEMLNSDVLNEYFNDDAKLEGLRQQMLQNIDQYEQMMPGFREQAEEIASDPEKWKEAMNRAREQIMLLKKQRDGQRNQNPPSDSVDDSEDSTSDE